MGCGSPSGIGPDDVTVEPEGIVTILAVGIKDRSRIIIDGEEVEL